MTFDVYFPFRRKDGRMVPGITPKPMTWSEVKQVMNSENVRTLCEKFQAGDKDSKLGLPAINFMGRCKTGTKRCAESQIPTQLYMIDIDHVEDCKEKCLELLKDNRFCDECFLAHITSSGKGLRLVMLAIRELHSIEEQIKYASEAFGLEKLGDVDYPCKDLSRISFLVPLDYILWCKMDSLDMVPKRDIITCASCESSGETPQTSFGDGGGDVQAASADSENVPSFSDYEEEDFSTFCYRGVNVQTIVEKYVETQGTPSSGEKHNFYNEMVKNFRTICDNNKRLLLYILPRFGHSIEECWSQIKSICRVNTLSSIPKNFYFFLKDNGFYNPRYPNDTQLDGDYVEPTGLRKPEYVPPVFREILRTTPDDFYVPVINALLPILGTLTSYLRAEYPYDGRIHSTSFFSVIYAPPGTGKGFVERFLDLLFVDLRLRDAVSSMRESIYLKEMARRSANDKAPEQPKVSLRLIPPKNSEAEFLQKQRDNMGYHMFTYAAEMDSWAKGVKAAGGNKDDMIRIAWDNGEYGQQFKSVSTFKGMVNLYWNVLITGTLAQVENYFKNVENGLVTRCSFCSIDNQEFVLAPKWKKLRQRDLELIRKFTKRCDDNTYRTPCTVCFEDLLGMSDNDFEKDVDWKFEFREKKTVDLSWVMPVIDAFQQEQMELAARDVDQARDVFRRRVGVRGFRLALICEALWSVPRAQDRANCCKFIDWWMHVDIDNMLKLWGTKYNEQCETQQRVVQRSVFSALGNEFTRNDVYLVCSKQGIRTTVRRILFEWKKLGYIEEKEKNNYVKKIK